MKCGYLFFFFCRLYFIVLDKESHKSKSQRFPLMFSSRKCACCVSFIFRAMISFEWIPKKKWYTGSRSMFFTYAGPIVPVQKDGDLNSGSSDYRAKFHPVVPGFIFVHILTPCWILNSRPLSAPSIVQCPGQSPPSLSTMGMTVDWGLESLLKTGQSLLCLGWEGTV